MAIFDSWPIEISLHEDDGKTIADARLTKDGVDMVGHGIARRNPHDQEVAQVGEEIAAARALSDLAHQLLGDAAEQIEDITHQRAQLRL
jgi:uncharacterized protein DUF1876